MKTIVTFLSSLFLGLVLSVTAYGESVRIFAVDEPPSSYIDDEGVASGFAVDVVQEIQRRIGNTDEIVFAPEVRVMKAAEENPNVVIFGFSRTKEREDKFHWITPLTRKSWVLYVRKDSELVLGDLEEAKSLKSIGVVRGDVREAYLEQLGFTNIQRVPYHELNIKMLSSERIEALYYEPLGMAYACQSLGIPLSDFEVLLNTKASEVYVLMSKNSPLEVVQQWTNAADAMHEDGTFDKIALKWLQIIYDQTGMAGTVEDRALAF